MTGKPLSLELVRELPVVPRATMELTRKQVAARLRRSVATVRRLEGRALHPRRDAQGVHWFSAEEVERLRRAPEGMRVDACSPWLRGRILSREERASARSRVPKRAAPVSDHRLQLVRATLDVALACARPLQRSSTDWLLIPLAALQELAEAVDELFCEDK